MSAEGNVEEGVVVEQKESLNIKNRGACSKIGRCGKCCIGCTICSVIVAAVLIPVLILVVAPKVAQGMLDKTTVALPNSTMSVCASSAAYLQNSAQLTIPGPLIGSATLHSYTQEVYTTMCGPDADGQMTGGWACDSPNVTLLGTYVSPEMSVSEGLNTKNFSVRMDINDSTIVMSGILPLFFPPSPPKASLILKARDISISVLGLKINGLTMSNEVTCSGMGLLPNQDVPNWVCYPDDAKREPYSSTGFYMSCAAGHHNLTSQRFALNSHSVVSNPHMPKLYRLARAAEVEAATASGHYEGGELDRKSGFLHLSTAEQAVGIASRYFSGATDLVLLAFDEAKLKATAGLELRWEAAAAPPGAERQSGDFPHLYGAGGAPWSALVEDPTPLTLDANGKHVFPAMD